MTSDTDAEQVITMRVQAGISQEEIGAELSQMAGRLKPISQWAMSQAETGKAALPYRHTWAQYAEAIERIKERRASEAEGRRAG